MVRSVGAHPLADTQRSFDMRWIVLIVAAALFVGASAGLAHSPDGSRWVSTGALGMITFSGCLWSLAFRRRREIATAAARPDSLERAAVVRAQAGAFVDAVVLGVALGASFWLFELGRYGWALVVLYLFVAIVDFWLRAVMRLAGLAGEGAWRGVPLRSGRERPSTPGR
jgi:hypothetical protein